MANMQRSKTAEMDLPWDDVRIFLALCRARTVGVAARALKVDSSTVSRRLAAIEKALAATLFDRGRNGIAPTTAAEALLPVAEQIEAMMATFANEADALERDVAGLVRIACPPDTADVVLAPLLAELFDHHPALRIELEPGEAIVDLTRREADLALRTVRPLRGDLIITRLLTLRWVLVAAPAVARTLGTLHAWTDARWVGWGKRLSSIAPARWLAKHVHEVEPAVRSDSLMVQLSVVAAGVGVALVPEPSIAHYGLAPVKIGPSLRDAATEWPTDDLFLVTHRALRNVPRVRVVWDLLVERMADAPKGRR